MSTLAESILIGVSNFPFFAVIFTLPIFLVEIFHYKTVNPVRVSLSYGGLLYMLCFVAVVFLPLPTAHTAARLSSYDVQLIPFHFVADIIRESPLQITDVHTYLPAVTNRAICQVIFNVLLLVPFGMLLRYCFHMETRKIVLLSFVLSAFVEITQFTGLYFIYKGSYRLCDIDDLISNTLGGYLGCYLIQQVESRIKPIQNFSVVWSGYHNKSLIHS